jgi:RNA polymerase sigma-70 factor (ECF subfamily)
VRPSAHEEAKLLTRARELDSRALGQIHDRYYPEIYRYALYRTGEPAAADDIAGEVFLRLLDALHAGRAPQTTLRGWLFGVAAHLVADYFRRAPALPLSEFLMSNASPALEVEERFRQSELHAAIRRLTPEQQSVLALRFGDGFSVEQTAEALGKSETAVKALQFRAVEALRRTLVEVENE